MISWLPLFVKFLQFLQEKHSLLQEERQEELLLSSALPLAYIAKVLLSFSKVLLL